MQAIAFSLARLQVAIGRPMDAVSGQVQSQQLGKLPLLRLVNIGANRAQYQTNMYALIVVDAQNEFSKQGHRAVPNFDEAVIRINEHVAEARKQNFPIAWIRHFTRPHESEVFRRGTWGSEFYGGFGPMPERELEIEFQKNMFGAFAGTDVGIWLQSHRIHSILIVGFYTHACVSTTAREAVMMDFQVCIDYNGTGACAINDPRLGSLTADEVRQSALLQLVNMGAHIIYNVEELNVCPLKVIKCG